MSIVTAYSVLELLMALPKTKIIMCIAVNVPKFELKYYELFILLEVLMIIVTITVTGVICNCKQSVDESSSIIILTNVML